MCQSRSKMLFCQFSAWRKLPFILLPFNLSHTSHLCSSNFSAKQNKPDSSWLNNNKWRGRSRRVEGEVGEPLRIQKLQTSPPSLGQGSADLTKERRLHFLLQIWTRIHYVAQLNHNERLPPTGQPFPLWDIHFGTASNLLWFTGRPELTFGFY